MLGILAVLALLIFLVVHFAFPEEKPFFKCALVNQKIDSDRDVVLSEEFATFSGLDVKRIVFDKFFFQWSKGELDAVILTKDFLKYCTSVGGEYYSADEFETKDLNLCEAGGTKAIDLTGTKLESELDGTEKEDLVLVFTATGIHKEMCQKYIDFLSEK